jgi:hypothetical protein
VKHDAVTNRRATQSSNLSEVLNIIQQDGDNNRIGDIGHKAVVNTYFGYFTLLSVFLGIFCQVIN